MTKSRILKRADFFVWALLVLTLVQGSFAQKTGETVSSEVEKQTGTEAETKGKAPIIVIPGLLGSELVNKQTEKTVWFDRSRAKDDDLRLPISPNIAGNRDNLVPGDILRNVKYLKFFPETEIYERLAGSLETPGGYREGKWDAPPENGFEDTYYVFPYDWRLDNVDNARLLARRMNELKRRLKRPNLKFNIIAHSMGGLIARYAARYGDADLPAGNGAPRPSWAGARHINKIFLVGTPNEGSLSALDVLVNGYAYEVLGINLPFVQRVDKFDAFTIPSLYQLLPHAGTARIYGDDLKPLKIDLFNPAVWEKYGWAAYTDPKFEKEFSPEEQKLARAYFRAALTRARRFQQAIDAGMHLKAPVSMYIIGSDCKRTLDGMIVYRDTKKNRWETIFSPESFRQSDGTKITSKQVREMLYTEGDGTVTKRSLLTSSFPTAKTRAGGYRTALYVDNVAFTCDVHNRLTGNPDVQKNLFEALVDKVKTAVTGKK